MPLSGKMRPFYIITIFQAYFFTRIPGNAIIWTMWSVNYCLLVFIGVVGVLQLAAAHNNLRSLLFFPRRGYTAGFAALAIGLALFAFLTWNDFNKIIVEGSQQTGSFLFSAGIALVFTLVFSSVLNSRRVGNGNTAQEGLDALRDCTYYQALRNHRNGKGR